MLPNKLPTSKIEVFPTRLSLLPIIRLWDLRQTSITSYHQDGKVTMHLVSFTEEEIAFLAGSRTLLHSTSQTWSLRTLCFQAVDLDAETLFVMTYLDLKYLSQANLFRNGKMHYEYLSETQQETVQNSNSSAQQDVLILSMFEQLNTQVMNCINVNLEYKSAKKALTTELDRYKEEEQGLVIAALKNELRKLKGKALDKEDIETHSVDLKKCIPKSFRDFAFHTYVGLALAINNLDPHISCGQHEELKDKKVRSKTLYCAKRMPR
ncbi:hypothetical protein Tco_1053635 [Tanacetum coccineum]|uniref:Uncharacterized protein n=1 Tax=Tanacetum coccineum TaxID=301880 RepID=A0ABQ5GUM3_9ASTR